MLQLVFDWPDAVVPRFVRIGIPQEVLFELAHLLYATSLVSTALALPIYTDPPSSAEPVESLSAILRLFCWSQDAMIVVCSLILERIPNGGSSPPHLPQVSVSIEK